MKNPRVSLVSFLLALLLVGGLIAFSPGTVSLKTSLNLIAGRFLRLPGETGDLTQHASRVMVLCAKEKFPPSCYDEEIPKLTDRISMEEAFAVVKTIQAKDPRYLYCHVVGHKLSDREVEKNPENWKDVITKCPKTFCNNGCLHGALLQRFNSETLSEKEIGEVLPDLKEVCEPRGTWKPVEVERSMCYHALGHLALYITGAATPRALALCRDIGTKSDNRNYVQTCTEGVFMQIFQPLEPEDFALIKDIAPSKEKVAAFCAPYRNDPDSGLAWSACRRESWPLSRKEILKPEGLMEFCSPVNNSPWYKNCFASMLNIITIELVVERERGSVEKLAEFCDGLQTQIPRETCFAQGARQLIQLDPRYAKEALALCAAAQKRNLADECYKALVLIGQWSFHPESEEFIHYCGTFPSPWNVTCRESQ